MNLEPRNIPEEDRLILMIETSQRQGSIALGSIGGEFIAEVSFSPGLVHSKELMPRIDTLIEEHASRSDLGVIAVSRGPKIRKVDCSIVHLPFLSRIRSTNWE